MRLIRPTGHPGSDRVQRLTEAFDEALLHHDMGLRGQQVITVLPEHIQRGGSQRIAALQQAFAKDATCDRPLLKPATATSATVGINQFPVPSGASGPGIRIRISRIMQHGDFIDCPIDHSGLDTHDKRPAFAVFTDQLCHVNGRQHPERQRIGRKGLLFGGVVDIVCLEGGFALGFRSSAEYFTVGLSKFSGLAKEGRFMRARNDGASGGVISQAKLSLLLARPGQQQTVPLG